MQNHINHAWCRNRENRITSSKSHTSYNSYILCKITEVVSMIQRVRNHTNHTLCTYIYIYHPASADTSEGKSDVSDVHMFLRSWLGDAWKTWPYIFEEFICSSDSCLNLSLFEMHVYIYIYTHTEAGGRRSNSHFTQGPLITVIPWISQVAPSSRPAFISEFRTLQSTPPA